MMKRICIGFGILAAIFVLSARAQSNPNFDSSSNSDSSSPPSAEAGADSPVASLRHSSVFDSPDLAAPEPPPYAALSLGLLGILIVMRNHGVTR
jgi:hypothetical protein